MLWPENCSTPLAQEEGLTAANPEWVNQWDLHSCDTSLCNNLKLTPAESVSMFIWKPFDLIEVLFPSVCWAINSCINITLTEKCFLCVSSLLFCVFSPVHGLQKKSLCKFRFKTGGEKGNLLLFHIHGATSMAVAELWSACSCPWKSLCSSKMLLQALQQSASTHQQRSKSSS